MGWGKGRDGRKGRWDGVAKSGGGRRDAVPDAENQGQNTGTNGDGDTKLKHTLLSPTVSERQGRFLSALRFFFLSVVVVVAVVFF